MATGVDLIDYQVPSKFSISSRRHLADILRSRNSDVVHTQGSPAIDLYSAMASQETGAALIVTRPVMIADLQIGHLRRATYEFVDRYTLRRAAAIVAVSQDGWDHLAKDANHRHKLRLIYNGVDLDRFKSVGPGDRRRFGLTPGSPVVGACGQLTRYKAWDEFLAAIQRLRSLVPGLQALIVGDGPLRRELEQRRDSLGLKHTVHFTGHLPDVENALACMDAYLFLSRVEGLSVALIEAMATSRACVVTDVGGAREQVADGETGFVIASGDLDSAVERVMMLLRDAALRQKMGKLGRLRAERLFDVKQMVSGYLDLYDKVAQSGPGAARRSARRDV